MTDVGHPRRHLPALTAGAVAVGAGVLGVRVGERRLLERWSVADGTAPPPVDGRALLDEAVVHTVATGDGAQLHVREWGAGAPTVCFHGISANGADWLPVLPHLLAAGHRVIAVDHRGHGASTLGSEPCNTVRLAADAAHVLEDLDVRDATVVGHSLGGYVALAMAALHRDVVRDRVRALVLLGTPHTGRGVPEVATLLSVASPWTPRLQRSDVHGAVAMGLAAFGRSPDRRDIDEVRYRWSQCPMATRRCYARHLLGERLTPLLGEVEVPALVARGTRDHIVTARRNRTLVALLPRARSRAIEGAGHALLCEQPRVVADTILEMTEPPS